MQVLLRHRVYISALVLVIAVSGCQQKLLPVWEMVPEQVNTVSLFVPSDSSSRVYNGLTNRNAVQAFYRQNGFRTVWIESQSLSARADSLINIILAVRYRGLLPQNYHVSELTHEGLANWLPGELLRKEVLLTDAFLSLAEDLRFGCVRPSNDPNDRLAPLVALMKKVAGGGSVSGALSSMESGELQYKLLKAELKRIIDGADPADAVLLKNGLSPGSAALLQTVKSIEINMERWRWEARVWPDRYVYVNIPSLMVEVLAQGRTLLQSKVIVGKPEKATPELTSTIQCLVTYPYWHVPRKISVEELLPRIQRDSTFLLRNNFDVLDRKGKVLNPDSIAWQKFNTNNFPVILRQREGPENSLGVIKFVFDNPYAVFLHDTNAPRLFRNKNRALSHGCIRVEKAAELAHLLIAGEPGKKSDILTSYLDQKLKHTIDLKRSIPVHIRYFTASVQNGKLVIYDDVYKRDEELIRKLYRPALHMRPL